MRSFIKSRYLLWRALSEVSIAPALHCTSPCWSVVLRLIPTIVGPPCACRFHTRVSKLRLRARGDAQPRRLHTFSDGLRYRLCPASIVRTSSMKSGAGRGHSRPRREAGPRIQSNLNRQKTGGHRATRPSLRRRSPPAHQIHTCLQANTAVRTRPAGRWGAAASGIQSDPGSDSQNRDNPPR